MKKEKAKNEKLRKENLTKLKSQIEERVQFRTMKNLMTENEKAINCKKTVKVNFKEVPKDMVAGLIGFTKPYDRIRQLQMIKRSSSMNKKLIESF